MISPTQRISLLQIEMQRLQEFLSTLTREDWQRASPCDQWTVADIVAHLTGQAQNFTAAIARALQGDAGPPAGAPPPGSVRAGSRQAEADVAHRALALRQQLDDHLLPTFIAAHRALQATLATIGPEDWTKLCYRPQGNESIQNMVDALITERTVHGWDIQSVFDPRAGLSPACLPIVVERIACRPRWRKAPSDAPQAVSPLRYRFEVSGVTRYSTDVVFTGTQHYLEEAIPASADVTFSCDGETFTLLMYGRMRAQEAISQGRMTYEGNPDPVAAFSQRFIGG